MALDSTLFMGQIPVIAYAIGDVVPLGVIRGPAVVRDGYGIAKLKRIFVTTSDNQGIPAFSIEVKNSNWVDSMSNPAAPMSLTSLDPNSVNIQDGQNCNLHPNSSWEVVARCIVAGTPTSAFNVLCLIDVDYPSVSSIEDPRKVDGIPVTIEKSLSLTNTAAGSAALVWTSISQDILKAGYKYLLKQAAFRGAAGGYLGFISISGAAGQAGLERIIPCTPNSLAGIKYPIDYATILVKGPMNINLASYGTAGLDTAYVYLDWVKKQN